MSYLTAERAAALVTREQAEQVLAAVKETFAGWLGHGADEPHLYEPGHHTSSWSIAWEGGPYDWPMYFPHGGIEEEFGATIKPTEVPANLFLEPVNGWCLGIYPDDF